MLPSMFFFLNQNSKQNVNVKLQNKINIQKHEMISLCGKTSMQGHWSDFLNTDGEEGGDVRLALPHIQEMTKQK